jgi:ferredoxin
MPWIRSEDCVACGVCIEECPVGAISIDGGFAVIDERTCIRCGKCHDVCPQEAVRHDSERIPQEVAANVEWTNDLLVPYPPTATMENKKVLRCETGFWVGL